jgi:eukaryotic-like serine/threonine-protein kinase
MHTGQPRGEGMVGQVADHYLIEEKIGEGAFAVVYKARDVRLNRPVALKVLKRNRVQDDTSWARLLAEGRAASALNHTNICKLFDIGEEQDLDYVVLELIEGQSLKAILRSGPLPTKVALRQGAEIAEALAHAHSAGVLHRDLTSSNILVTHSGTVKVIDFGLAKFAEPDEINEAKRSLSSLGEAGWLGGTLPYMAPELLHGETATAQSDIWSLGVLLYEMLTGSLPFVGGTMFELSMAIMIKGIEPLSQHIPPSLRGIVCRCLAKDRTDRYQSAFAVYCHLQAELSALDVNAAVSRLNLVWKQPHQPAILPSLWSHLARLIRTTRHHN